MASSCILAQFSHLADLTDEEKELLVSLERNPKNFSAGDVVRGTGDDAKLFFTLRSGWACAIRELADGDRQVLDIFLPGQIMGLREVAYSQSLTTFLVLEDAEICPFPKKNLTEIFDRAPRLADLFFLISSREQSMLVERIINLGRRSADQRLAHFLLEIKARLNQCEDTFSLPLKQTVIGDTLGLSAVHVSRTIRRLREAGLVTVDSKGLSVADKQGLIELADFNPVYLEHDVDWVRQAKVDGEVSD